jgi:hypothetical protein
MRTTYVQDPVTLELVPKSEYRGSAPVASYIIPDIAGYKSMQTGEWIPGRRQHREHLKQHRLVEIGNEPIRESKPQVYNPDDVKRELARHIYS